MNYLVNDSIEPYFNMALDEWCLENLSLDEDVFYLWRNRPSVIVGLNQNVYSEVNIPYLDANGILLVRRVTGGGAVYHDLQNLNYTILRKLGEGENGRDAVQLVADALLTMGVNAEVSGRNDITVGGHKVSGFARRVWKDREIIHGTLMYDVDIETLTEVLNVSGSKLESKGIASVRSRVANLKAITGVPQTIEGFAESLHAILSAGGRRIILTDDQINEVSTLAADKFTTWDWTFGRSHEADIIRRRKLASGTVEAEISLNGGIIRDLHFGGDFLGSLPASQLASKLLGLRYERKVLSDAVEAIGCGQYFENVRAEEIVSLLLGD